MVSVCKCYYKIQKSEQQIFYKPILESIGVAGLQVAGRSYTNRGKGMESNETHYIPFPVLCAM